MLQKAGDVKTQIVVIYTCVLGTEPYQHNRASDNSQLLQILASSRDRHCNDVTRLQERGGAGPMQLLQLAARTGVLAGQLQLPNPHALHILVQPFKGQVDKRSNTATNVTDMESIRHHTQLKQSTGYQLKAMQTPTHC